MFEKLRVKAGMDVADSRGQHVGIVDEVTDDDRIKLSRADSTDGAQHYIALDQVGRIEANRIYLKLGTPIPIGVAGT